MADPLVFFLCTAHNHLQVGLQAEMATHSEKDQIGVRVIGLMGKEVPQAGGDHLVCQKAAPGGTGVVPDSQMLG
jgi:hypothetical protein